MGAQSWQTKLSKLYKKMQGSRTEYNLDTYLKTVKRIHGEIDNQNPLSTNEIKKRVIELKQEACNGKPLDELLVPCFALTYIATKNNLNLIPHDEQLIAAIAMHEGKLAELQTGEGKTLAAVFTAVLNSLSGQGVHVLTFNDYLAKRDANWMLSIYKSLGVSTGVIQQGMTIEQRQENYQCDVTYLTAKEAGFDFLRDSLVYEQEHKVQRALKLAIVDEADSILIDEARIPLVIAEGDQEGQQNNNKKLLGDIANWVQALEYGIHFETDDQFRNIFLTQAGADFFQKKLNCDNLYAEDSLSQLTRINHALHAEYLLRKNIDYIVKNGRIELVDDYTGRVAKQRRWPNGIQHALEAKEGISKAISSNIINSITLQHYIKQYQKITGMTATAAASEEEFETVYQLPIVCIDPHHPSQREDLPDLIFQTEEAKRKHIIEKITGLHHKGRPVLVGTGSIQESMSLSRALVNLEIPCHVLNAKHDEQEAQIIARAGKLGAVTISTNMAGRGTDILLGAGDPEERQQIINLGGLHVIGTEKHETRRIDLQLCGRAGRQGDPGSTQFMISLEDELFQNYPLLEFFPYMEKLLMNLEPNDKPITAPELLHCARKIQTIAEEQNWQIKYTLCKYAHLPEQQRQLYFQQRDAYIQSPSNCQLHLHSFAQQQLAILIPHLTKSDLESLAQRILLKSMDYVWSLYLEEVSALKENIHLTRLSGKQPLDLFQKEIIELFSDLDDFIEEQALQLLALIRIEADEVVLPDKEIRAPSNTWTYLINDNFFSDELQNALVSSGSFAASAAGLGTPFLLMYLLLKRHFQKLNLRTSKGA